MPVSVEEFLGSLITSKDARATAWDAVHTDDAATAERMLRSLPFSTEVKARLWDARQTGSVEPFTKTAPANTPQGPQGSAAARFAGSFWDAVNPITAVKSLIGAVTDIPGTAAAIADASINQARQSRELFNQGRYVEAAGHGLATIPMIGPAAAAAGEQGASGDVAGMFGSAAGLLAPIALSGAKNALPQRVAAPLTAEEQAIRYAAERGIPLSVGETAGNWAVRGAEQLNEKTSPTAAYVAKKARLRQVDAVKSEAADLAHRAYPEAPVLPEEAGASVTADVSGAVRKASRAADDAYTRLRAYEQKAATPETVGTRTVTSPVVGPSGEAITTDIPVTQTMLGVDVRAAKDALRPVYDRLLRESELVPLQGGKGRALTALDRLMTGPDRAALSDVDSALGDLKAMARTDVPELRTQGQGIAAQAVKVLDRQVRDTALRAGPQVLGALEEGRKATRAKYLAQDVLERLAQEPVGVFRKATQAKDAAIDQLREVAAIAPATLPKIGRAFLEDLFGTATAEGGFAKAAAIATKWQELGPETKRLLFAPSHVADLDRFFLFAKRAGENLNPSQSGYVIGLSMGMTAKMAHPIAGVAAELGQGAVAALMTNQKLARLFVKGLTTPANSTAGRRIAAALRDTVLTPSAATGLVAAGSLQPTSGSPR
jgi:hypothetical protein